MMDVNFNKDNNGIHLMNGEFTLCGYAWDCYKDDCSLTEMKITKSKTVTCEECVDIIETCKKVKTKASKPKGQE